MSMMQNLQEKALKLELQIATSKLMAYLFPGIDEIKKVPGRYHFFGQIIGKYPQLLQALLDGNKTPIQNEWSKVLHAYQSDVRFLHALCIVYWEAAQAKFAKQESAEQDWVIATALWVVLLVSDEFWDYFSQERWTNGQGERLSLNTRQQEDLMHDALDGILTLHSIYGKQSFAAGHFEQAKIHVHCLDMCWGKGKKMLPSLQSHGIPCVLRRDDQKLDWVTLQASKILDEWCVALVAEAEKETNDADAIKKLPQGIRKNYEGGIRVLEPFIALNIPITRVLSACLDWYNDWCYDIYVLKDMEQLKKLVKSARVVADQLMPFCVKEQGYTQENQRISQHFLLRGFVLDDPKEAVKQYKEALAWNPANGNAAQLLEQSFDQSVLEEFLKPALEHAEKQQFDKAYQVLDAAEQRIKDKKAVRDARAAVCFLHGRFLAEEGKYREALNRARQACRLDPTEEVLQKFVETMEELAPEEDNVRLKKKAEEALKNDRYEEAIQHVSRIPDSSIVFEQACQLLAIAYFQRGITVANDGNLAKGEEDLRYALKLIDDDELRAIITKQLSAVLTARALSQAEGLQKSPAQTREELMRRLSSVRKLLGEALKIDPSNTRARTNLNTLNDMLR